jgi:hypothetical protein
MKFSWLVVPALAVALVGCSSGDPLAGVGAKPAPASPGVVAAVNDGITLTNSTPERVTGVYRDANGVDTLQFDLAKVGDNIFADLTGDNGRPIVHVETTGDAYTFSYMGGGLTLQTTKTFIASAQAANNPQGVSTSGFAFTGDMHVLDDMLRLPEVAALPTLSRALGVRGITGSDFPSSLVLHKMGRQAADALGVHVQPLDAPAAADNGYCQAYPNTSNDCYGMCGPNCSCWSWVCGDCCYHYGCAVHDNWCREGEWYFCYDITAVIALFGC